MVEAKDKRAFYGLKTGFPDIDKKIGGLKPANVTVIAARPGMGKSSFALHIIRNVAEQGSVVGFFSLEETKKQLANRRAVSCVPRETWDLLERHMTKQEAEKLSKEIDKMETQEIYVSDAESTIAEIRRKARRMKRRYGLDLLVIDYLQLIIVTDRAARENRTQEVTYISTSIKRLARELQCPIIAISQLSRAVDSRPGHIPQLCDLRESGTIEQDAHHVLFLKRDDYYEEDCDRAGITDVYVAKNRTGPTGRIELRFVAEEMSFRNVAYRTDAPALPVMPTTSPTALPNME